MKALVYDPYVDTLGGGERYVLTFAAALQAFGYQVELAWKDDSVIKLAKERFGLDLSALKVNPEAYRDLSPSAGLLVRYRRTSDYDLVFWVSDGSLPYLFARKNLLHFQVPFKKIGGNPINNFMKSTRVDRLVFNSHFTASVVKKQLPFVSSTVLYPPIDTAGFKPGKKENVILSVARFDSPSHAKRQDVLIKAMAELTKKQKGWQLILAGAVKGEGGEDYLSSLKNLAGKLPVKFIANPNFDELTKLYAKAKIFWHAAGYDVDETLEPEKVEHFGITTVEAMAAGAVPIVIDRGGQREIVTPDSGHLCASIDELVTQTLNLIMSPETIVSMGKHATERASHFSQAKFRQQVSQIIK